MSPSSETPSCGRLSSLLRQGLILLALPLVPALLAGLWHPRKPDFIRIEVPGIRYEQALKLGALWIDARPEKDHVKGHVAGAISLNPDNYESQLPKLIEHWRPGQSLVVYCDGGGCQNSRAIALRLKRDLGIEEIRILEGGWPAARK